MVTDGWTDGWRMDGQKDEWMDDKTICFSNSDALKLSQSTADVIREGEREGEREREEGRERGREREGGREGDNDDVFSKESFYYRALPGGYLSLGMLLREE